MRVTYVKNLMLLMCLALTACDNQSFCEKREYPEYDGHRMSVRGSHHTQNSLAALEELIDSSRFTKVEFDVRTTADNELVVYHDDRTCRYTDDDVNISRTQAADLPLLSDGQSIPFMSDVIEALDGVPFGTVYVDVKAVPDTVIDDFEDMVSQLGTRAAILWDGPRDSRLCDIASRLGIVVKNYDWKVVCR